VLGHPGKSLLVYVSKANKLHGLLLPLLRGNISDPGDMVGQLLERAAHVNALE
jgi:hypothetical protein